MAQDLSSNGALREYRFWNRLFWLGLLGIIFLPVLAFVAAFVIFQITKNSNLSAPVGLSGPFWSVGSLAMALLVRGTRKRARRSVELAKLAETLRLEFSLKATTSMLEPLKSISFMKNPTSAKGRNVLTSADKNLPHFAIDYFYAYDYGAVSFEADESMVVFPEFAPHLPDLFIFPIGLGDQLLGQFFGAFGKVNVPHGPEFPKHFHVGSDDPATAERMLNLVVLQVFHQNPKLSLVIENGTLIVFYQLRKVAPQAYTQFLSAAHQLAQALHEVR